ncbi:MAG: ABC transporter substrate-binding protein [Bacteroidales bacterium]|nr:ABC transporter substrate-binding protein [Bacteroidales bacterium]
MKTLRSVFLLSIFTILFSACQKQDTSFYKPISTEEIRIGVLISLSGSGYSSVESSSVAIALARQDITGYFASAGIKEYLVLDIVDTRTDTAEALKQMKSLYDRGIRMVIGPYTSAELAHVKSFADTHGMLVVSPSSVSVSLAQPGDNIFRLVPSDVIQGKAMSKLLADDKIRVIVPLVRDDVWGNDLVNATRNDFIKSGGLVQPAIKYDPATIDFTTVLDNLHIAVADELTHHNPNEVAVYMISLGEGTTILSEAKKHSHLNNVYWYGSSGIAQNASLLNDTTAALFAYTHGLPCPVFGLDDAAKNLWQPLRDRIAGQIGRIPDVYAFTSYDALWVLIKTYRAAGKDPPIDVLRNIFINEANSYFGVSGNTQLDTNGDRASGNYDFWAVKTDTAGYCWKRVARYNSLNGTLNRVIR